MALQWCEEAEASIAELDGSADYIVFTLVPKPKPKLVLQSLEHKGQGGRAAVEQIVQATASDQILVGAFCVSAIDERGSVTSVRRKYVHVVWRGESLGVLLKGRINTWTSELRGKFPSCAVYLQLAGDDLDDLQESVLQSQLLNAGGAHKPKRFSFSNRTLMGKMNVAPVVDDNAAEKERQRHMMEEARQRALEDRKRQEEAKRQAEEERQRAAEADEEKQRALKEARRKAEEERLAKAKEEEEARKRAEEAEAQKRREDAELRRKEEQARLEQMRADEEAKRRAAEEARRKEEEEAKRLAEEKRKQTKHLIAENNTLDGKQLVLLTSSMSGNFQQSANTSRLKIMIDGFGLPDNEIEHVDGSESDQRERRNQLFGVSGLRAQYPQVFLQDVQSQEYTFIGDFETMQYYNDEDMITKVFGITTKVTHHEVPLDGVQAGSGLSDEVPQGDAEAVVERPTQDDSKKESTDATNKEQTTAEIVKSNQDKSVSAPLSDPSAETVATQSASVDAVPKNESPTVMEKEQKEQNVDSVEANASEASATGLISNAVYESAETTTKEHSIDEDESADTSSKDPKATDLDHTEPIATMNASTTEDPTSSTTDTNVVAANFEAAPESVGSVPTYQQQEAQDPDSAELNATAVDALDTVDATSTVADKQADVETATKEAPGNEYSVDHAEYHVSTIAPVYVKATSTAAATIADEQPAAPESETVGAPDEKQETQDADHKESNASVIAPDSVHTSSTAAGLEADVEETAQKGAALKKESTDATAAADHVGSNAKVNEADSLESATIANTLKPQEEMYGVADKAIPAELKREASSQENPPLDVTTIVKDAVDLRANSEIVNDAQPAHDAHSNSTTIPVGETPAESDADGKDYTDKSLAEAASPSIEKPSVEEPSEDNPASTTQTGSKDGEKVSVESADDTKYPEHMTEPADNPQTNSTMADSEMSPESAQVDKEEAQDSKLRVTSSSPSAENDKVADDESNTAEEVDKEEEEKLGESGSIEAATTESTDDDRPKLTSSQVGISDPVQGVNELATEKDPVHLLETAEKENDLADKATLSTDGIPAKPLQEGQAKIIEDSEVSAHEPMDSDEQQSEPSSEEIPKAIEPTDAAQKKGETRDPSTSTE